MNLIFSQIRISIFSGQEDRVYLQLIPLGDVPFCKILFVLRIYLNSKLEDRYGQNVAEVKLNTELILWPWNVSDSDAVWNYISLSHCNLKQVWA